MPPVLNGKPCYRYPASHATGIRQAMLQPSGKPCYSHPESHATGSRMAELARNTAARVKRGIPIKMQR